MTRARPRRWVDYATWSVAAVVVALAVYLVYAVWAQNTYNRNTSPAMRAVSNLEQLVRKSPNNLSFRLRLAQALTSAGLADDAITQYEAALKLQKDNSTALMGLGLLAMETKQWKTAESYWRRLAEKLDKGMYATKDSQLEAAYHYLGLSLYEQRRYEEAVGCFKEALRIRRDASDTHLALALTYRALGMPDRSVAELRTALLFDPGMPEANYEYGQVLLKRGDVAAAAECFRRAADKAPKAEQPQKALLALGSADDHLKKALALQATKVASATVEARVAVALDPMDGDAVRLLAALYEKSGKKAEALSAYQKLLGIDAGDKAAVQAVKRLTPSGK